MRTITCGDCGRPISDSQRACPYCGYPVNMSINKMLQNRQPQQSNNTDRNKGRSSNQTYSSRYPTTQNNNQSRNYNPNSSAYNQSRYPSSNNRSRSALRIKIKNCN